MKELVDTPIRVTEIQPGMVETSFSITRMRGDKDKAAAVSETQRRATECVLTCCVLAGVRWLDAA